MANHMKPFWIQDQSLGDDFYYLTLSQEDGLQVVSSRDELIQSIAWPEVQYFTVKSKRSQTIKITYRNGVKKHIIIYNGEKELKRFFLALQTFVQLRKTTNYALQAKYTVQHQQVAPVGRVEPIRVVFEDVRIIDEPLNNVDEPVPLPPPSPIHEYSRNSASFLPNPPPSPPSPVNVSELVSYSSCSSIPTPPPPPPPAVVPSERPTVRYDSVSLPAQTDNTRVDCLTEMRHLFSLGRLKPSLIIDPKRSYSWSQPSTTVQAVEESTEEPTQESTPNEQSESQQQHATNQSPGIESSSFLYTPRPPANSYGIPAKTVQQALSRLNQKDPLRSQSTSFLKSPKPVPLEPILIPLPTLKYYSHPELLRTAASSRDHHPTGQPEGQRSRTPKPGPAVPPKPKRKPEYREMLI